MINRTTVLLPGDQVRHCPLLTREQAEAVDMAVSSGRGVAEQAGSSFRGSDLLECLPCLTAVAMLYRLSSFVHLLVQDVGSDERRASTAPVFLYC